MNRSRLRHTIHLVEAALVVAAGACGVSTTGLGPAADGSAGGAGGSTWCPAGLTDQAGWPTNTSYTSCSRPCGPDGIGVAACSQTDRATCQAKSGCLCLEAPCVACGDCAIQTLPDCYVPTNAATATLCANGVSEGGACGPACGHHLCLQADGTTACVCNKEGKYACADWNGSSWQ
jgi:hypothetical protein